MADWIKVTERLPEIVEHGAPKSVMVAVECAKYEHEKMPDGLFEVRTYHEGYEIMGIAQWRENGVERYWSNSDLPCSLTDITHWCVLPMPPEKGQA